MTESFDERTGRQQLEVLGPLCASLLSSTKTLSKQFYKTRLCPYHISGFCRKGSHCTYAHDQSELHRAPDLYKTKICPAWQKGCCKDAQCRYAHGWKELRSTDQFYKTRICHFWLAGDCNKGQSCRHAHGLEELQQSGSSNTTCTRTTVSTENLLSSPYGDSLAIQSLISSSGVDPELVKIRLTRHSSGSHASTTSNLGDATTTALSSISSPQVGEDDSGWELAANSGLVNLSGWELKTPLQNAGRLASPENQTEARYASDIFSKDGKQLATYQLMTAALTTSRFSSNESQREHAIFPGQSLATARLYSDVWQGGENVPETPPAVMATNRCRGQGSIASNSWDFPTVPTKTTTLAEPLYPLESTKVREHADMLRDFALDRDLDNGYEEDAKSGEVNPALAQLIAQLIQGLSHPEFEERPHGYSWKSIFQQLIHTEQSA